MMKRANPFQLVAPVLLASTVAGVSSAYAQAGPSAIQSLLEKAHALETRGRLDMASQTWQQVLLADPNNTEALGGLARAAKLSGNLPATQRYLDRLRSVNPNDPAIARVESMGTQQDTNALLRQAGRLAQQGQYTQAMDLYRQVYGNNPPPGDAALGYYETEAGTDEGRPHAIDGLRSLLAKNPGDVRYQIALGRLLTYNPKTRVEGRRMLSAHMTDPDAARAYRDSLLFDVQNPAATAEIRAWLASHNDQTLADAYENRKNGTPATPGTVRPVIVMTPDQRADQAAYHSLNAHQLAEAEKRFQAILAKKPENAGALAGMGYVRMQQGNFGGALSYLSQAKQDGSKDRGIEPAIATSRFWNTMAEGGIAADANDLPLAERNYRAALTMRPDSPQALEGLGGILLKAGQPQSAAPYFVRYVELQPNAAHAWRGLFLAQYGAGNATEALATAHRMPAPVAAELARDPLYLSGLASAYTSTGHDVEAQRVLEQALQLPFPADAGGLEAGTQLQYASILQAAHHWEQAAGLYRQVLTRQPDNTAAWEGLVGVQHLMGQDQLALQTIESMPKASYTQAIAEPGFDQTVASIYQSQKRYDVAQDLLEKTLERQLGASQKPSVAVEIQLAGVYLQRNNPQQAYPMYQKVLVANSGNTDAWKGLLSALHDSGRDGEVLAQVRQIPAPVRAQLENDPNYLQTIASVYTGLGDPRDAETFLRRAQQHYAAQNSPAPANVDIQNAWLLYNAHQEQGLYQQLMMLGDRQDLTPDQRRTVQIIWTNLAVRRANLEADHGNDRRAIDILNATADSFPDNPEVPRILAGGYAKAGNGREAVAIWKAQDLTNAPAADYASAAGAALAANDGPDAENWLRFGLQQYPRDSQLLTLAAKYEVSRGDTNRAEEYYDAALEAMPKADPGTELADELSRPGAAAPAARPQKNLFGMLQPNTVDTDNTAPPPESRPPLYLPGYGNAGAGAPVSVPGNGQSAPVPVTPPQGAPSTLRDYVPQASVQAAPLDGYSARPVTYASSAEGTMPILIPAVYYQPHLVRITDAPRQERPHTETASFRPVSWQQGTPPQTQQTQPTQQSSQQGQQGSASTNQVKPATPAAAPAPAAKGDVYGPYVPYVPPVAKPVPLGATPAPSATAKPEVTDVLPTAHYLPNAKGDVTTTANPDVTAADAAARRRQARTGTHTGQSHPADETIRTTPVPPTEPVTYLPYDPASQTTGGQNGQQVPQPTSGQLPPAQRTTVPQNATGSSEGQQYPQPGTQRQSAPVYRSRRRAHAAAVPTAAPVAPATPRIPPVTPGMSYPGIQQPLTYQPYPMIGPAYPLGNPPSDYDLMQQRLPPLRGRYYTGNVPQVPLSEREQTELDLHLLDASYSGWLGGTGSARYRSGTAGVDRLTDVETSVEASATVGNHIRFSVVPKAVFLNSGTLDTADSVNTSPVLGTLPGNAANAPEQQSANGVGGELQVATRNFAGALGYTPYEFLVSNITGRVLFRAGQHFTLFGDRSPVTETELSFAGLRDPGSVTPVYAGNIWGGVISTGGGVRFDAGNERAGFYISADGADLTGYHVLQNNKFEGSLGAYFLAHTFPGYGRLNVGASLFGMHYASNERPLTYGLGGYFSPQSYLLVSVPVTFAGRYQNNFHYTVQGSLGVQSFTEASQLYYPLDRGLLAGIACTNLQVATGTCTRSPSNSNTGGNYSINSEGAYRIADHWYAGGFFSANNTNNYNTVTGGFFVRYLFRQQYSTDDYPTGLFPVQGFRPLRVP